MVHVMNWRSGRVQCYRSSFVSLLKQLSGSSVSLLLLRFDEVRLTSLQTDAGTRVRGVVPHRCLDIRGGAKGGGAAVPRQLAVRWADLETAAAS